jgi:hypothetical protein
MAWKSPKRMNGGVLRNVKNKITPAVERKDLTLARRGVDIIRASELSGQARIHRGRARPRQVTNRHPHGGDGVDWRRLAK